MTATAADSRSTAGATRGSPRRSRFWIVLGAILLAVVAVALLAGRGGSGGAALAGDNAAPAGGKAVVEVLRQHGVHVRVADSFAAASRRAAGATVLLYDPEGYLDGGQLRRLGDAAGALVLVEPGFAMLHTLAPNVDLAGAPRRGGALDAHCSAAAARRAGTISGTDSVYRSTSGDDTACFPAGGGAAAMVATGQASHPVTVIGSTAVFANESVIEKGNAALALGMLGQRADLVWYLPTIADAAASGPPSLAELTPGWVTPAALLAIAVFAAAAVWRGRRFGPLVIERLPVIVRAEETMEGRARLYQRSSARGRALDALRIGAVSRIAALAGLPAAADIELVIAAAVQLSGMSPSEVRDILVDAAPRSDAELMRLTGRLDRLEAAARASALHAAGRDETPSSPSENPNGRMAP